MKEKTEENSLREEREREREIALPLYSLHQTSCIPFTSTCLRTEETPVPILQYLLAVSENYFMERSEREKSCDC